VSTAAFTCLITPIVTGWAVVVVTWMREIQSSSVPEGPPIIRVLVLALTLGAAADHFMLDGSFTSAATQQIVDQLLVLTR
jgi:hypothetical protein